MREITKIIAVVDPTAELQQAMYRAARLARQIHAEFGCCSHY